MMKLQIDHVNIFDVGTVLRILNDELDDAISATMQPDWMMMPDEREVYKQIAEHLCVMITRLESNGEPHDTRTDTSDYA